MKSFNSLQNVGFFRYRSSFWMRDPRAGSKDPVDADDDDGEDDPKSNEITVFRHLHAIIILKMMVLFNFLFYKKRNDYKSQKVVEFLKKST